MTQAESFSSTDQSDNISIASASFLSGGGEMGERIRAFDWSTTPLGSIEQWPQSLLMVVATSIRSRFPIVIWWNSEHYTMLYNDAYIPFLGKTKHPRWLGRSGKECWQEIWPTIGPMLEGVFETGDPTWSEDLLLIMDRNLPHEETYFTFSYSAIPGNSGAVEGIFCACTETTGRVIGERRLQTLRDLASLASQSRSAEEACEMAARLFDNKTDIPFALIYLLNNESTVAHLIAHSGIEDTSAAVTQSIPISQSDDSPGWPLGEVAKDGETVLVSPLPQAYGTFVVGPWLEAPQAAVVLPMFTPGQMQVTGWLILGVNPRRVLDESYQDFFKMAAGHVATAIANARAYEEERRRAEALAELDRAKTVFFSNISHEFRTPLTLMLGPIEDLLSEAHMLSPAQRESTELLHRNTLRLLRLVNTLLDFSRIEIGRIEAIYQPVDLAALTADLVSNFRSAIEKAGMHLRVECVPDLPPVYVDEQMWEKIVLNLLSNAFKYTLQGTITVRLSQHERMVELSVQDTGVGIPAEELPHMFERFHRVKGPAGRTFEGSGIGLSLVHELVMLHGGTISVSSKSGIGSTFTVSLPLGSAHLPQDRIRTQEAQTYTTEYFQIYVNEALRLLDGNEEQDILPYETLLPDKRQTVQEAQTPARILFADDNADMREYVSRLLQPYYFVQTVADGKAALEAVREDPPDLILTDVMMPHMDGFELLSALRADQKTSLIPVILLSARAGEEAKVEGMAAGADDYLIKPFSKRELLARVKAHVEMARQRKEVKKRIQAERQRLYDLFMRAPAIIHVLRGPNHVFELINPQSHRFLGIHRSFIGKPIREALPELEGQGLFEILDEVYQTGQPILANEAVVYLDSRGNGMLEEFYFDYVYQPSYDSEGKIDGILVYAIDVTELVKARKRSEELSRQKDEFVGFVSHELKTPITSLKGFTQLLERQFREGGDERSASWLHKMDRQLNKLTSLVEDLLDITKMESGRLLLRPSFFEMNELINEIAEETQHVAGKHRILQELTPPVTLYADRERIGQVLTNLLTNAIKYSPKAETVRVKTELARDTLITSVQDFGIGIDKEQQTHLFERFYRVEGESQLTYPGLGLGLYISAEFVKRHRGSIWIESEPDKGTKISFSLPLPQVGDGNEG